MGIFPIFLSFVVFPLYIHLEKSYPFFTKVGGGSYDIKEYNVRIPLIFNVLIISILIYGVSSLNNILSF